MDTYTSRGFFLNDESLFWGVPFGYPADESREDSRTTDKFAVSSRILS